MPLSGPEKKDAGEGGKISGLEASLRVLNLSFPYLADYHNTFSKRDVKTCLLTPDKENTDQSKKAICPFWRTN